MKPRVNILWAPGTNCHDETAHAFELAGGKPQLVLLNRVISGKEKLSDCDIFCLPGGFSFGDHVRAGWIQALDLVNRFSDQIRLMLGKPIPILGICNGMQVLAAAGLLNGDLGKPTILMDMNKSGKFEHRQNVQIMIHHHPSCLWTEGLDQKKMSLPVANAEGRPVFLNDHKTWTWKIAAMYGSYELLSGSHIAGISHGHIFAMMPHPERRVEKSQGGTDGLAIFKNGVKAVK